METYFNRIFYTIITASVIVRIIAAYFLGDGQVHMEWGRLVHNLNLTGVLGINVVIDEFTAEANYAEPGSVVLPSVFMPPLYAFYIYFLKILSFNFFNLVHVVIASQIILSIFSIYLFLKILMNFFKKELSLILTIFFAFFPLYIYSSVQASSITLQIFLILLYFYNILIFLEYKKIKHLLLFSLAASFLILIRGEFFLFYFLTLIYFFIYFKFELKSLFFSFLVTIILISPYLNRNYENFGILVLTKSFGYNLLKGNNPDFKVEGSYEYIIKNFNQKSIKIKTDSQYEIKLDNFYKNQAIKFIKESPADYLILYFKKAISFLFFDLSSSYENYYNPLHILPKIFLSIFSFFGLIICYKKKGFFQFLSIFYLTNIMLFSLFFILPRYSLILLPVQILLSAKTITFLRSKFFN